MGTAGFLRQRQGLPAYECRAAVLETIGTHTVSLVLGAPGGAEMTGRIELHTAW